MRKYIPLEKRTKKEQKEYWASQRQVNGFNTGERPHETDKKPSRAKSKRDLRKELKNEN